MLATVLLMSEGTMTNSTRWSLVVSATLMLGACGGSNLGGTGGSTGSGGFGGTYVSGFGGYGGVVGTGGFGTGGFETGGFGGDLGGTTGTGGFYDGFGGTTGFGGYGYGGVSGTGGFWCGTGGVPGAGGDFGAGGEFFGTGGFGGTYGCGTGGVPGTGGSFVPDGGTCSAPTTGPISTQDSPRPFGWSFTLGANAPGTATGADGGTADGLCHSVPAAYPGTSCVGAASLLSTISGPEIVFEDGSQLLWDGTLAAPLMPYVAIPTGEQAEAVWVDYERRVKVVCPECGAYETKTLEIRSAAGGKVRFYDQQGDVLPSLTDAQVLDIFGVTATPQQTCTFATYAGCYSYLRSEFDQQLGTVPPQTIVDATLTKVTAPNGTFQVIWASSAESYVQQYDGCQDGAGVASDTGFVAALLAPPATTSP